MTDADAELNETRHWLDTARACEYINMESHRALTESTRAIGKKIGAMMRDASSWCSKQA